MSTVTDFDQDFLKLICLHLQLFGPKYAIGFILPDLRRVSIILPSNEIAAQYFSLSYICIFFIFSACLTNDLVGTQQLYVGLSARKLVQTLCQRTLVLFKLFLLEKKVLFFQSPVLDLCTYFLTLLSLHPGMLEEGLKVKILK